MKSLLLIMAILWSSVLRGQDSAKTTRHTIIATIGNATGHLFANQWPAEGFHPYITTRYFYTPGKPWLLVGALAEFSRYRYLKDSPYRYTYYTLGPVARAQVKLFPFLTLFSELSLGLQYEQDYRDASKYRPADPDDPYIPKSARYHRTNLIPALSGGLNIHTGKCFFAELRSPGLFAPFQVGSDYPYSKGFIAPKRLYWASATLGAGIKF
jgi:hypothetical protein